MMEIQEQEPESQTMAEIATTFPITTLPVELQLQILGYVLAHDKPVVVSGFTDTPSFSAPRNSTQSKSTLSTSTKPWSHLPFSIMLASKHMNDLCQSLLFAPRINTFLFTTPPTRQWSYARDWYWTFSFMIDHNKGTSAAMKRMSRILFKCDGSLDNSLIGTAVEYMPSMVILTMDFKEFWGSPSATLEEEGRRSGGLGGFGGHVVLPDRNQTRTPVYSAVEGMLEVCQHMPFSPAPTATTFNVSEVLERSYTSHQVGCGGYGQGAADGKEGFVSVVWTNVVMPGAQKRVLKELRLSGLKMGKGNWDEVVGYGERVAGRKGVIEVDREMGL